jgi:hypothetical protein
MTKELTRRVLGAGFAAALLLGGAACGDDDANTDDGIETDQDDGFDTGDGLGGTEDESTGEDSGVVDGMGGTDDE